MSQEHPLSDTSTTGAEQRSSFVPQLDARQRAMLAEMGVRVWAPKPAASVAPFVMPVTPAEAPALVAPAVAPAAAASVRAALNPAPRAAPPAPPQQPAAQPATAAQPMADGIATMDWSALRDTVASCQACGLCEGRTRAVFGVGAEQADWMVVGDAPGADEDLQGEPYLGEAGQLLDNMLRAVGRSRTGQGAQAAFVTHVTRCRPNPNRNPQPAEVALCAQYLARQVALVSPQVIVAMGPLAAQALLQSQEPIGKLRGQVHRFQGVPVIVTFPPSQLMRTPANKAKAWADLCLALEQLPAQA
jgi:uracil-DNA glycosylase